MNSSICVITLNKAIPFEKQDHLISRPYSHFVLRIDQTTIAHGKVLRYKPIK